MQLRAALRNALLSTLVMTAPAGAYTDRVTLVAGHDNTLYQSATGALSNGAGSFFFAGRTSQLQDSIRRGLVAFVLTDSIPAGSTIDSATVVLHMSKDVGAVSNNLQLRRVAASWGEGTSDAPLEEGQGAASTTGDATWIHRFFSTVPWNSAGGDFASTPSAVAAVGAVGFYTWASAGLVADVQAWVANPGLNFGWIVIGDEATSGSAKRFDTRENPTPAFRPRLVVKFRTPVDATLVTPTMPRLHPASPNPFNPGTTIAYELPAAQYVVLRVHDVAGRLVRTLVDRLELPGAHRVAWDGRDDAGRGLGSGVYYCELVAGRSAAAQRLVLVK